MMAPEWMRSTAGIQAAVRSRSPPTSTRYGDLPLAVRDALFSFGGGQTGSATGNGLFYTDGFLNVQGRDYLNYTFRNRPDFLAFLTANPTHGLATLSSLVSQNQGVVPTAPGVAPAPIAPSVAVQGTVYSGAVAPRSTSSPRRRLAVGTGIALVGGWLLRRLR